MTYNVFGGTLNLAQSIIHDHPHNTYTLPAWGAHQRSPDPLVSWGVGYPSQSPSPRRLRHLDSRAFGAQLLWPNVKSWLRPWTYLPVSLH